MTLVATAFILSAMHATSASQFGIYGTQMLEAIGGFVSSAGDMNNDGILDTIVCPLEGWTPPVVAYIVNGAATIQDGVQENLLNGLDLASFNSTQGFRIVGFNGISCKSASALGDVNGDGIDDIILWLSYKGVYVVFGRSGPMPDIDLAAMPATVGVKLSASMFAYYDECSVARAGDVNGDGLNDIIIGAPTGFTEGRAFVVYGSRTLASIDLLHMSSTTGYTIYGPDINAYAGFVVGSADVNGDRLSDLIVAAPGYVKYGVPYAGIPATYVLFGSNSTTGNNVYLSGSFNGFRVTGVSMPTYEPEMFLNVLGDVNGDGLQDFMVKSNAFGNGDRVRPFAVVYGKTTTTDIDLRNLDPIQGVHIREGSYPSDDIDCNADIDTECCYLGGAADGVLDYNGDGYADIALTVICNLFWRSEREYSFAAVIFGDRSLQDTELAFLDGESNGFKVWSDSFLLAVSSAGMTSDGYSGLAVGAPYSSPYGRSYAGTVTVFYGKNATAGDLRVTYPPPLPTQAPSPAPSAVPTTSQPSESPSIAPSSPTSSPSFAPSQPTVSPTYAPSAPSQEPSSVPTAQPSGEPTGQPTSQPVEHPTSRPSRPTVTPTVKPSSQKPSKKRTTGPSTNLVAICVLSITNPATIETTHDEAHGDTHCKTFQAAVAVSFCEAYQARQDEAYCQAYEDDAHLDANHQAHKVTDICSVQEQEQESFQATHQTLEDLAHHLSSSNQAQLGLGASVVSPVLSYCLVWF